MRMPDSSEVILGVVVVIAVIFVAGLASVIGYDIRRSNTLIKCTCCTALTVRKHMHEFEGDSLCPVCYAQLVCVWAEHKEKVRMKRATDILEEKQ